MTPQGMARLLDALAHGDVTLAIDAEAPVTVETLERYRESVPDYADDLCPCHSDPYGNGPCVDCAAVIAQARRQYSRKQQRRAS